MRTVAALAEHAALLLAVLPAWRLARLHALTDGAPEAAIVANIAASSMAWCGLDGARIVNLGGVLPSAPGTGLLWQFLGDVRPCLRGYVRQQRAIREAALGQYERLTVLIETSYPAALRHMRRLGFQVGEAAVFYGMAGHLCERTRL